MKITKFLTVLLLASACLSGCGGDDDSSDKKPGTDDPGSGALKITLTPSVIHANGTDATKIEVRFNDQVVTEGVEIYDGNDQVVNLQGMTFTTDTPGEYTFWAAYKTYHTEKVKLTALAFPVPVLPNDPEPAKTSFTRRVLLTQFTGTKCGWCPFMIFNIRSMMEEEAYASKIALGVVHGFNSDDPAYLSTANLPQAMGVTGYPDVVVDMHTRFNNYNSLSGLKKVVDQAYARTDAKAGIAVSADLHENTLVARVEVKAAAASEFRIGAWVLEDGIEGAQTNNGMPGNYNTHDNCVRLVDARVSSTNYTGHSLGTLAAGEKKEYVFVMQLEDKWVKDNLKLLVYVCAPEKDSFYVNNAVVCQPNGTVSYSYK